MEIPTNIIEKANSWLCSSVDAATQDQIKSWLASDPKALIEAFYADLEFGTGGLRGIMGVGSLRINKYTIGMATQGLANYITQQFPNQEKKVAIAYDSRNNSRFFADTAAQVLSSNGIHVHLFEELRPTPLLSFAVRELHCQAGIVITASHNPAEYNGYKVYWSDGAQVLPPHDKGIIDEVRKVTSIDSVSFEGRSELIHTIGPEVETHYLDCLKKIIHSPKSIAAAKDLKIVFTPIHGTGVTLVPRALQELGFAQVRVVESQATPDGNFPTVHSPNPEEKEALQQAITEAEAWHADIVLGTDPDADRVGLAVRNHKNEMVLLNGNQTGSLLVYYQLLQLQQKSQLLPNHYVAKTIVTTDLIEEIATSFGVKFYNTLTGFKYIAGVIGEKEGKEIFIGGGEESYGYLVGEFVRDKDAVLSSVVMCETAAWCQTHGSSLWLLLMDIYSKYGLYHEQLVSLTLKGIEGVQKINDMMSRLRSTPPTHMGGSRVVEVIDVLASTKFHCASGRIEKLDLPKSNVLQFILEEGSKISARPSGTEPKIKFYFSMKEPFLGIDQYTEQVSLINKKMSTIQQELGL